jgi:hypothetical protein
MAGKRKVEGLTSTASAMLRHRGRWGAVVTWRSSGIGNGGSKAWDAMAQEGSYWWGTASSRRRWKWRSATKHRKKVRRAGGNETRKKRGGVDSSPGKQRNWRIARRGAAPARASRRRRLVEERSDGEGGHGAGRSCALARNGEGNLRGRK